MSLAIDTIDRGDTAEDELILPPLGPLHTQYYQYTVVRRSRWAATLVLLSSVACDSRVKLLLTLGVVAVVSALPDARLSLCGDAQEIRGVQG